MARHPDRIDVTLPVEAAQSAGEWLTDLRDPFVRLGSRRPSGGSGVDVAGLPSGNETGRLHSRCAHVVRCRRRSGRLPVATGTWAIWAPSGDNTARPPGPRWSGRERHSLTKPVKSVSERAGSHARQPGRGWPAVSRALNPGRFLPRVARSRICRMRARAREFAVSAVHPRSLVEATPLRRALWTRSAPPRGPDHGHRGGSCRRRTGSPLRWRRSLRRTSRRSG